jgi:hypothetical protein
LIKANWHKPVLFTLTIICCLFVLQFLFNFGIKHNLNIKTSYVTSHKIDADFLVLGPCEPLWMVAPAIITKKTKLSCYNLAGVHSDFADNYLHLYLYLQNNKAPAYLLLFTSPQSFDLNNNTFYSYRFSSFLQDTVVANTVKECDSAFYTWSKIPFVKYAYFSHQTLFNVLQGWKHYFTKRTLPYYPDGFEPPAKIVWDNHAESIKKKHPKGNDFMLGGLREKYLYKILTLCKEKHIQVFMYESPVLKKMMANSSNQQDFEQQINFVAKNMNLPFISFKNLPMAEDKKQYISPIITNLQGSYLFSDTLAGYLATMLKK